MALSKKRKKIMVVVLAIVGLFFLPFLLTETVLRGTWNGNEWSQLKANYPGLRLGLGGKVTVSSRPELVGKFSGNTITWNNGSTWTRS